MALLHAVYDIALGFEESPLLGCTAFSLGSAVTANRHVYMARILALTGMTPEQVAIVTAHQARVDEAFCCDFVAEHIAATLRPHLFADALTT